MLSYFISKVVTAVFGMLYPAYSSYIAVKTKDVRGYVHWMMYWIVFAFFNVAEPFVDAFVGTWFPFYYEIKIGFVIWLMSPITAGAGILYRRFVHPRLLRYEPEIEICIANVKEQTSSIFFQWASRAFNTATEFIGEIFWNTAVRANSTQFMNQLRRSYSRNNAIQSSSAHQIPRTESYSHQNISQSTSEVTTPNGQFDLDTYFSERMQHDLNQNSPRANNVYNNSDDTMVISEEEDDIFLNVEYKNSRVRANAASNAPAHQTRSQRKKESQDPIDSQNGNQAGGSRIKKGQRKASSSSTSSNKSRRPKNETIE